MPTRSAARLPPAKRAFRRTVRSDDDRSGIDEERPACFSRSFRQACGQARPTKSRTDIAPTIFIAGETSIRNSEIAHHPRFSPRAMLGAISYSRCQTTRVRLMPLATSTCDTKTDAETFSLRTSRNPTGGARRDRTDDLLLAKQALSQLSYGPEKDRNTLSVRLCRHAACNMHATFCNTPATCRAVAPKGAKAGGPGKI